MYLLNRLHLNWKKKYRKQWYNMFFDFLTPNITSHVKISLSPYTLK